MSAYQIVCWPNTPVIFGVPLVRHKFCNFMTWEYRSHYNLGYPLAFIHKDWREMRGQCDIYIRYNCMATLIFFHAAEKSYTKLARVHASLTRCVRLGHMRKCVCAFNCYWWLHAKRIFSFKFNQLSTDIFFISQWTPVFFDWFSTAVEIQIQISNT